MQYTLTDTWQAVTATTGNVTGTIYNCGNCDVEVSAEAEPVNGTGILLRSGTTLQYNKPVKARTYDNDDAGKINVESFNTAASGGTGGGYTLPAATTSALGGVIVGDNLSVTSTGKISIADASASTKGVVQIGDGLKLDANGKLTLDIGDGLTIDANGKLTRTQNTTDTDIEHLFYDFEKATGTYVAGTTYYTDDTGATEVDTTDFVEGVTDVSEYYIKVYL